jgi:TPR repeat protein
MPTKLELLSARTKQLLKGDPKCASYVEQLSNAFIGNVKAMVELAYLTFAAGDRVLSDEWILAAEQVLPYTTGQELMEGRTALLSAYNLAYGPGDFFAQEQRSRHHMETLAESGNAFVQNELAHHYLYGLNGFQRNKKKAEYWARRAKSG